MRLWHGLIIINIYHMFTGGCLISKVLKLELLLDFKDLSLLLCLPLVLNLRGRAFQDFTKVHIDSYSSLILLSTTWLRSTHWMSLKVVFVIHRFCLINFVLSTLIDLTAILRLILFRSTTTTIEIFLDCGRSY